MSTFNGWTIVPLPTFPPVPKSVEWEMGDTVGSARSPFSQQQQIQQWNASLLRASVSYQPMTDPQARPWLAFLAALQGVANIFQFGDPVLTGPQSPAAVAGAVSGANQTGYTLNTTSSGLTLGDWIQIGLRLYLVTSVAGGALGIWPQIRETPADGTPLVITNTQGLFRLTKNQRKISVNTARHYGITFEIEEAI